jgi:hypothetical protein
MDIVRLDDPRVPDRTVLPTKQQVRTLESLIKSLPNPSAPFEGRHLMRLTRTAPALPTDQTDEPVVG